MAKVDLYNARGLAKQAVGTPGIDKTGAYVEGTGRGIMKETDLYIKAESAKIKLADNILAQTEKIKWENGFFNEVEEAKRDPNNINNPQGLADSIFDTAQKSAQEYAKGISNPRARDIFLKGALETSGQAQKNMHSWASNQITTNAFVNVKEGLDAVIQQSAKVNDQAGFNGVMSQGEALIANATPIIGVDNAYKLRQHLRKEAADGFIYSKIDASPGAIKAYVNNGMFDGVLDEKEQHSVLSSCDSLIKRNERLQKGVATFKVNEATKKILDKAYDGTLTLAEINSHIVDSKRKYGFRDNSKMIKMLYGVREHVINNGAYKYASTDRIEAIDKLDEVFKLFYNKGTKRKPNYTLEVATANNLQDVQDALNANRPYLSKTTYEAYQRMVDQAWLNSVENNPYAEKELKQRVPLTGGKLVVDEYMHGMQAGYAKLNKRYSGEQEKKAKVLFSQLYNRWYDYERHLPEYSLDQFVAKQLNHVYENVR